MKKCLIYLFLALFLLGGTIMEGKAVSQAETGSEGVRIITDLAGRKVEVPDQIERIVAVGSGALRQVVYLGAADKVVGVEEIEKRKDFYVPYNLAHPEFKELPTVGPQHGGEAELILAQNPDVIFFRGDPKGAISLQQKTGIPVIYIEYGDFYQNRDIIYKCWQVIGKVLNKEARAAELKQYTMDLIKLLQERTENIPESMKPAVYAGGISHRGGHGIASTKVPFPPLHFVNARSVTRKLNYESVTSIMISREKLLTWNPEIIFIDNVNYSLVKNDFDKHLEYKVIKAFKNGDIYGFLPYSFYHRNYGTILVDSYYIGKILYPDQFNDIEINKKAEEIFQKFVGKPVFEKMKKEYGGLRKIEF